MWSKEVKIESKRISGEKEAIPNRFLDVLIILK